MLVEGESDRRAVLAVARLLGRDLEAAGARIVSMDGVTNLRTRLAELGADAARRPSVLGLYDVGEAPVVARMLDAAGAAGAPAGAAGAGVAPAERVAELERRGFYACSLDLEDELIRALGAARVEGVLRDDGDLARFRVFQGQPAQRGRPVEAQLRRFSSTKAGRKKRFAAELVEMLEPAEVPRPLRVLVERASAG